MADEKPKRQRGPLLIIFLVVFIDLLGFGVVLPLLNRYGEKLGASGLTLGLLVCAFSAMQFLFSPIWGRVSDHIGRRPVLLLGLFGSVLFYALFGYASAVASLTLMFVARIGAGIVGATIATAQAYIADSTPPDKRTAGMALIGAAFGIGFTFGPLLGIVSLSAFQPKQPVEIHAAVAPATPAVTPATGAEVASDVPPLAPHAAAEASEGGSLSPAPGYLASGISAIAFLLALVLLPESLKVENRAASSHWFNYENFRIALTLPTVRGLILVGFISVFGFASFETTLSLLTKRPFGMSDQSNYGLYAYIGFLLILAQGFLVRRLSRRVDDARLAFAGIASMLLAMLGVVASIVLVSKLALYVVMPLLVAGFALLNTSVQSLISKRSRPDQQGGILGANQAVSSLARIVGPVVGLKFFDIHVQGPYWTGAGLLAIALILLFRMEWGGNAAPEV